MLALNSGSTWLLAVTPGAGFWSRDLGGSLLCDSDVVLFGDGFEDGDPSHWSSTVGAP